METVVRKPSCRFGHNERRMNEMIRLELAGSVYRGFVVAASDAEWSLNMLDAFPDSAVIGEPLVVWRDGHAPAPAVLVFRPPQRWLLVVSFATAVVPASA